MYIEFCTDLWNKEQALLRVSSSAHVARATDAILPGSGDIQRVRSEELSDGVAVCEVMQHHLAVGWRKLVIQAAGTAVAAVVAVRRWQQFHTQLLRVAVDSSWHVHKHGRGQRI